MDSSHFVDFEKFKQWRDDPNRDKDDVCYVDDYSYNNIKIIYFPPSATSSMQPLDGGAFCWIQDRYRKWLNTYLIEYEEKPPKLPMKMKFRS